MLSCLLLQTQITYDLVYALADANINAVYLSYPRFLRDADYFYARLQGLLSFFGISREAFLAKHGELYIPSYINGGFQQYITGPSGGSTGDVMDNVDKDDLGGGSTNDRGVIGR